MIVPMKKVSLITLGDKKEQTLKKLRSLGIVHIEISEGSGEKLNTYNDQIMLLERASFAVTKSKKDEQKDADTQKALKIAQLIDELDEQKSACVSKRAELATELDRVKGWGEIDLHSIKELLSKGIKLSLYEMPKKEYVALGDSVKTIKLDTGKSTVKFALVGATDSIFLKCRRQN